MGTNAKAAYHRVYEILKLWSGDKPQIQGDIHRDAIMPLYNISKTGYGGLALYEFLSKTGLNEEFVQCIYNSTGKTIDGEPVYKMILESFRGNSQPMNTHDHR